MGVHAHLESKRTLLRTISKQLAEDSLPKENEGSLRVKQTEDKYQLLPVWCGTAETWNKKSGFQTSKRKPQWDWKGRWCSNVGLATGPFPDLNTINIAVLMWYHSRESSSIPLQATQRMPHKRWRMKTSFHWRNKNSSQCNSTIHCIEVLANPGSTEVYGNCRGH